MTSKPAQNKEIGLAELLVLATRNWAVLALAALVGAAIGLVVIRMITDKYRVTSLVQIDTQARRPSGSLGDMASMFQTDARSETETELIQSKSVVGEVVDSLGLRNVAVSKSLWRKLRKKTGRMELAALRIPQTGPNSKFWTAVVLDSDNIALRDTNEEVVLKAHIGEWTQAVKGNDTVGIRFDSLFSEKGEVFTIGKPPRAFVAEALLGGLKVAERGRRTGVLELSYTHSQPAKAQRILNAIAATYVKQNIEVRSAEARKSLEFLQQQMPVVRQHLDSLEDILKNYRFEKGTVDIGSEARSVLQEQADLQQQVLTLQQRRQELLRLYREDHPSVAALDAQIKQVQTALSNFGRQVRAMPLTQQAIAKLSRDVDVNTALYTALLNNIQQLQVIQGGEAGNARIVDPAELPMLPVGPSKKLLALAILLVFVGGTYTVLFLRHSMDTGIEDAATLETATGSTVLSQVPLSSSESRLWKKFQGKNNLLAVVEPTDLAIEALRSLRTGLELSIEFGESKVVTVTGLALGEGKSFLVSNLAILYAQAGKKVVLVDADMRRGRIGESFGLQRHVGFSDYLKGHMKISEVVQQTNIPGLSVIPAGPVPNNPSELLSGPRLEEFMKEIGSLAEIVLIDTPPVIPVTDPIFPMKFSQHSLVVVAAGHHTPLDISEGMRKIRGIDSGRISFVLNKCDWARRGVGYYLRYGKYETKKN